MKGQEVLFSTKRLANFARSHVLGVGVLGLIGTGLFLSACASEVMRANGAESQEVDGRSTLLNGEWDYMPGSRKTTDGLRLEYVGFSIVEQDGSGDQPNPPINLFGTRLEVVGDFSIQATIEDVNQEASIWLYGKPPILADEFRIEREGIRILVRDKTMAVSLWDGSSQNPVTEQSFTFSQRAKINIEVKRQGHLLIFSSNDQVLGSIEEKNIFKSGQVWLGPEAPSKDNDWLLSDLSVQELNSGTVKLINTSTLIKKDHNPEGLQALVTQRRPDFQVGVAMALGPIVSDVEVANVVLDKNNFGSWTTENVMKMQSVQPRENMYDFRTADALVKLAEKHHIAIHGHAAVFGEANPPWFNNLPVKTTDDKKHIERIMLDHVSKLVGHYKGQIKTWDIVNEPLADEGGLRNHKWHQAMGEGYIAKAFHAAHQADPKAQLFINEYGLESGDPRRFTEFLGLIDRLKSQNVPIHGVGMQAHVYEPRDRIEPEVLRSRIQQLAKRKLAVRISEMDVYAGNGVEEQSQQYKEAFEVALSEPNVVGWTAWILTNRYDVYKDDEIIRFGQTGLYDTYLYPTLAINKLQKVARDK